MSCLCLSVVVPCVSAVDQAVLFISLTSRAIHLPVAPSLHTFTLAHIGVYV